MKKLYRSDKDKMISGIIGGLGEYMDIDPTILRLAYVIIAVVTGIFPAIIGYFVAMIIVPKRPGMYHAEYTEKKSETKEEVKTEPVAEEKKETKEDVIEL